MYASIKQKIHIYIQIYYIYTMYVNIDKIKNEIV